MSDAYGGPEVQNTNQKTQYFRKHKQNGKGQLIYIFVLPS